ncbi:transmembrane protein [Thraustotheca clavata]|uniref:Transmembrane protein n=1 Tax=Thraustotheca clavata TaxID=74557 RepID=A0A1W0A6Q7_9STRA|nr:transmembrane protein [Thraustotheca clavata]
MAHTVEALRGKLNRIFLELFEIGLEDEPSPPFHQLENVADMTEPPTKIRVLSMNVWGIPVTPYCTERATAMGAILKEKAEDWDIIALQEVWHRREKRIIVNAALRAGFAYSHYFHPAVGFPLPIGHDSFGTGLLVLSKFRLSAAMYHPFLLTGRPYALHEADFIANKGVGILRVHGPDGTEIADLYVTHLLANYNHLGSPGPGDQYLAHRAAQAYELATFINSTSRNSLVMVCGDFNSPANSLVLKIVRDLVALHDAYADNHMNKGCEGLTFGTEDNKFSHGEFPMRMDYILFRSKKWRLVASDVYKEYFTTAKGYELPLSDHFGVYAEFHLSENENNQVGREIASADVSEAVGLRNRKKKIVDESPMQVTTSTSALACLNDILLELQAGKNQTVESRIVHLQRSFICFLVVIAGVIGMTMYGDLLSNTSWYFGYGMITLVVVFGIFEYIISFFFLTLEVSSFTEFLNQVLLHRHNLAEALKAQQPPPGLECN